MSEPPSLTNEQLNKWFAVVHSYENRNATSGERADMLCALAYAAGAALGYEQGAQDMRERCAQICDQVAEGWTPHSTGWLGTDECRRRIRALDPAPDRAATPEDRA